MCSVSWCSAHSCLGSFFVDLLEHQLVQLFISQHKRLLFGLGCVFDWPHLVNTAQHRIQCVRLLHQYVSLVVRLVRSSQHFAQSVLVTVVVELEEHVLFLVLEGNDGLLHGQEVEKFDSVAIGFVHSRGQSFQSQTQVQLLRVLRVRVELELLDYILNYINLCLGHGFFTQLLSSVFEIFFFEFFQLG